MHALDWLNELGRILHGAIQPIEGVHFYHSRYRGLFDRAFSLSRLVWYFVARVSLVGEYTIHCILCG